MSCTGKDFAINLRSPQQSATETTTLGYCILDSYIGRNNKGIILTIILLLRSAHALVWISTPRGQRSICRALNSALLNFTDTESLRGITVAYAGPGRNLDLTQAKERNYIIESISRQLMMSFFASNS
jgi:hypothetical protein